MSSLILVLSCVAAFAQEPAPVAAPAAAPVVAAPAPAPAEVAAPAVPADPAAPVAPEAAPVAPAEAIVVPETDAEAAKQAEEAVDAFSSGKIGLGVLLLVGVGVFAFRKYGKKKEKSDDKKD